MAPARMMQFVDKHVRECAVCREDSGLHDEVEKIREFVLPESKIPKAIREVSPTEICPDEEEEQVEEDYGTEEEATSEEYIDDDEYEDENIETDEDDLSDEV